MKNILIITILSIFAVSCSNTDKAKQDKLSELKTAQLLKVNEDYIKSKLFYQEDLVNHFPEKIDSNYITYTESVSPEAGLIRLDLICKLNSDKDDNFKDNAIAIYSPLDECLLIANRFANDENYSYNIVLSQEDSLKIDLECYNDLYPIPNFWHNEYTTNSTECKLPEDFSIYVLDAKVGKFFEDKLLTDGKYMPAKWKNGYSKGVAVSEEKGVIIYWIIVW